MNESKPNVPKLRFPGFTDPWEQRKVSELLEERNEQAPQSDDYPLMAFVANEGVAPKGERYDRSALINDAENKLYKRTRKGDFIYSSNNLETGSIGLNNLGNACISPVYSIFKPTKNVSPEFIGRSFLRKEFINKMVKYRQGVIYGQWRIHETDFLRIKTLAPSLGEQQKIGSFFRDLDALITLHQRKLNNLKLQKRGLLQKMFPKDGADVPELRFPGFTDPWEQRKLGEIADIVSGGTPATGNPTYWDGDINWFAPAEIGDEIYVDSSRRKLTEAGYNACSTTMLPAGRTVLFTSRAGIGSTAILRSSACTNQGFQSLVVRDEASVYFVYSMTPSIKRWAEVHASGSTFLEISGKTLAGMSILIPSLDEQRAIGQFFEQFDALITLHQRKLDHLKLQKKALLQQMFV